MMRATLCTSYKVKRSGHRLTNADTQNVSYLLNGKA